MSLKWVFAMAVSIGTISTFGLQAAPALASVNGTTVAKSALVGVLGYEGGPAPGGFHPTSGSVEVEFTNVPLVLDKQVGSTGHFRIPLGPGTYKVIGCGPSSSGGQPLCGQPKNVTIEAGEVDHIRLVWAFVP
jgi:hypothetical protein